MDEADRDFDIKYRPKTLDDVVGQDAAVKTIRGFKGKIPRVVMLHGGSGQGKTTLARIIAHDIMGVPAGSMDMKEVNCGVVESSIDMVREINSQQTAAPMFGSKRVWILDECFHRDTPVTTERGDIPISQIVSGDRVPNAEGVGTVVCVAVNRVSLDRVVRLEFEDGGVVFTTKDHELLTSNGWVRAGDLNNKDCIVSQFPYPMNKEACYVDLRNLPEVVHPPTQEDETEDVFARMRIRSSISSVWENALRSYQAGGDADVSVLQESVQGQGCIQYTGVLFQEMRFAIAAQSEVCAEKLCFLPKGILAQILHSQKLLFGGVRERQDEKAATISESSQHIRGCSGILEFGRRAKDASESIREDEEKQPIEEPGCGREDQEYQESSRNTEQVAVCSWGKRATDQSAESSLSDVVGEQYSLESRIGDRDRLQSSEGFEGVPNELQGRYRKPRKDGGCRDRWEQPQVEKVYLARCQENPMSRKTRVACVTVYQPGSNDQLFCGIVSDTDRRRGFVEFYDLQVEGHPSYHAAGILVHNCQVLSRQKYAMEALLKVLEDCPDHVQFFLATTDPKRLLPAIRSRCVEIAVRSLKPDEITGLINRIAKAEKITLTDEVRERIVALANGGARDAVKALQKIAGIRGESEQLEALGGGFGEDAEEFAIVRALCLYKGKPVWATVAKILLSLEDADAEGIRCMILAAARTAMLKGPNGYLCHMVIEALAEPMDDRRSGKAVLASRLWEICNGK